MTAASPSRISSGRLTAAATAKPVIAISATLTAGMKGGLGNTTSDKAATSQDAEREHHDQPARALRTLEGGESGKREPRQDLLERRERVEHAAIEIAEPGIDQMSLCDRRRPGEQNGRRQPTCEHSHWTTPSAARRK